MSYVVSAQRINKALREVSVEETPKIAENMYKAIKLFVKNILGDRDLYHSIDKIKVKYREAEAPSLDEISRVFNALLEKAYSSESYIPAVTLYILLAESGVRVETLYGLRLSNIDLGERIIKPMSDRGRKRDWFSFFTNDTRVWIERFHIPYIEYKGLSNRGKLFPFKPRNLRIKIYEAMDETLGYRFELKMLRKRFSEHMSHHLSSLELNILMGHAPRSVVEKHYLLRDSVITLREKYDKAIYRLWRHKDIIER